MFNPMKKKKYVLYGARLKRYFIHYIVFWVLMLMFYICSFGSSLLTFFVLLAVTVAALILAKIITFDEERSIQLTKETVEEFPAASGDELRKAYKKRVDRELRYDALAFLLLAVFIAVWLLVAKLSGASDTNVILFGFGGLTVAPIAIAISLFIISFLPRKTDAASDTLEKYIKERTEQPALSARLEKPDLRFCGPIPCFMDQSETPTVESVCASLKSMVISTGVTVLLIIIRVIGYSVALLNSILFWPLLWIVPTVAFAFIFYFKRRKLTRRRILNPIKARTYRRLMKNGTLVKDRVLSVLPGADDGTTLEICFERAGTVLCTCPFLDVRKLLKTRDRTAFLLMLGKSVQGVFFVKEEEVKIDYQSEIHHTKPAELPPLEERLARMVDTGEYPSDEQIREAALTRLDATDPAVIKAWADEKEALRELSGRLADHTPAERERSDIISLNITARISGTDKYRDLRRMESKILEEGITRKEIVAKKNLRVPFRAYLPLIIAAAALVAVIVIIRLIQNRTGAELSWAYVFTSTVSGILSLRFASVLINTVKIKNQFKKLKEAYRNPEFWSAMIEVEKYKAFNKRWEDGCYNDQIKHEKK